MPTDSDSRKLERIESALSNLEISADSVNLNTDGLEAKLDTANGILTTLSADTALLKADVADGVGVGSLPAISGTVTVSSLPASTVTVSNANYQIKSVVVNDGSTSIIAPASSSFRLFVPTGASPTLNSIFGAVPSWVSAFADVVTFISDTGASVNYYHDGSQWTLDDFTTPAGTLALLGTKIGFGLDATKTIGLINGYSATQTNSPVVENGAIRTSLTSTTVTVSSLPAISGTVTVGSTVTVAGSITALPVTGGLNDYSGSVTSADTSYDVVGTNASRRYALVQNISDTGMWLGIGTAATTTSGIFLASNSGIVWESGYIPTPTLSILCTTSGKRFVVKEI
jgi:hypothetical protein